MIGSRSKSLLHFLLLDLPLIILFFLFLSFDILHNVAHNYFYPIYNATNFKDIDREERERTSPTSISYEKCSASDISTSRSSDILLDSNSGHTVKDAVETTLKHGASAYRDILTEETAADLRSWVLHKNAHHDFTETYWYGVQMGKNREVLYPSVADHPSLITALKELTSHSLLTGTLEQLLGSNPAVYELSFITSHYGAAPQNWHQDLTFAHSHHSLTFAPSFSLFIPLQNTTKELGASNFCPGTHLCDNIDKSECDKHGFALVTTKEGEEKTWKAGDGAIYNGKMYHRGGGHDVKDGPARVLMIVSFTPRPHSKGEYRVPSLGTTWGIKYNMFGHTLNDLANADTVMRQPWATLRAFGVYKLPGTQWGWDYVTLALVRMANLDPGFDEEDYEQFLKDGNGMVEDMDTLPKWLVGNLTDYRENVDDKKFWEFYIEMLQRVVDLNKMVYGFVLGLYSLIYIVTGWMKIKQEKEGNDKAVLTKNGTSNGVNGAKNGVTNTTKSSSNMNGKHRNGSKNASTTTASDNTTLSKVCMHLLLRLYFLHIPFLLFHLYLYHTISSSQWARDIETNTMFKPPFPPHPLDNNDDDIFLFYLRSVAEIRKEDVLFPTLAVPGSGGEGYDVNDHIGSRIRMNEVLDVIHEGNKEYYSLIEEFIPNNDKSSPSSAAVLPSILIPHAARHIVQQMVKMHKSRFLIQNEFGDYTPISYETILDSAQDHLVHRISPCNKALEDTLDDMFLMYQFGPKRDLKMYKEIGSEWVEHWSDEFKKEWFDRNRKYWEEKSKILLKNNHREMISSKTLSLLPASSRARDAAAVSPALSLKPLLHLEHLIRLSPQPAISPITQKCINDKQSASSSPPILKVHTFSEGEMAEVWEGGYTTIWNRGKVLRVEEVEPGEWEYDVEHEESGDLIEAVRGDEMRRLNDMDIVW